MKLSTMRRELTKMFPGAGIKVSRHNVEDGSVRVTADCCDSLIKAIKHLEWRRYCAGETKVVNRRHAVVVYPDGPKDWISFSPMFEYSG